MAEESVQEPEVEQPYRGQHRERGAAFNHVQLPQQRRDTVAHDPSVEAHADTSEGLRPYMVNDADAERNPYDQAREDVGNETGALGGEHAGQAVRRRGEGRFGEPDEAERGSEVPLGEALIAQHHGQRRSGDRRDGVEYA
jgi:hypothetical protein